MIVRMVRTRRRVQNKEIIRFAVTHVFVFVGGLSDPEHRMVRNQVDGVFPEDDPSVVVNESADGIGVFYCPERNNEQSQERQCNQNFTDFRCAAEKEKQQCGQPGGEKCPFGTDFPDLPEEQQFPDDPQTEAHFPLSGLLAPVPAVQSEPAEKDHGHDEQCGGPVDVAGDPRVPDAAQIADCGIEKAITADGQHVDRQQFAECPILHKCQQRNGDPP